MFNPNQTKSVFWLTLVLGAAIICFIVWSRKKANASDAVAVEKSKAKSKLAVASDEKVDLTKTK
jgi:hypothetical protein